MTHKKKLIEVVLPLDEINKACIHEKSVPRKGHPATMHLWWARRPLASCRAIIASSIIDDPSNTLPPKKAKKKRERLLHLIGDISKWENTHNLNLFKELHQELKNYHISILDPFCGGGSIPIESARLGLNVISSDLNPIPVLITKSVIELPQKYLDSAPKHPRLKDEKLINTDWKGAKGLAEDVRAYARDVYDKTKNELGYIFPKSPKNEEIVCIINARTVKCPNPACGFRIPMIATFWLCKKKGKNIWIDYELNKNDKKICYKIVESHSALPKEATKSGRGASFKCLNCNTVTSEDYVRSEGKLSNILEEPIAVVCQGQRRRAYYPPDSFNFPRIPDFKVFKELETDLNYAPRYIAGPLYGYDKYYKLFSKRQLAILVKLSENIIEIQKKIFKDTGDEEYSNTILTYLAFGVSKSVDWCSNLCSWIPSIEGVTHTFSKQALAQTWDYAEVFPLSNSVGNFLNHIEFIAKGIEAVPTNKVKAKCKQLDVKAYNDIKGPFVVITDPPYYDNIGYSDLADFFYVWLRYILSNIYPDILSTILTPKSEEIVANPYRFNNDKKAAKRHFLDGMQNAFIAIRKISHEEYPMVLYYAFKQIEEKVKSNNISSTGWETMLDALINTGWSVTGTWPMRTERQSRSIGIGTNALASSIVIVCRPRVESTISTRREFVKELKKELPFALKNLQDAGIAPVDLAQSSIGPGMAIFSKYSKVLEADGNPMSTRTALHIINQELDLFLTEQESIMDNETRFCITWFEQFGWNEGPFGDANTLATAKGTAVNALEKSGLADAKAGKVMLIHRNELNETWDPTKKSRLTVWECVQYLIKSLEEKGENGAAEIVRKIGGLAESVKELSYRLYSLCEKKGWAEEALSYNLLISSWQSIYDKAQFGDRVSRETKKRLKDKSQKTLFGDIEG